MAAPAGVRAAISHGVRERDLETSEGPQDGLEVAHAATHLEITGQAEINQITMGLEDTIDKGGVGEPIAELRE